MVYGEDEKCVYRLCAPLYGACTSSRVWHKTMSAFTKQQGFKTVSFENSVWCCHDANGENIMVGSHIDDFCICCTNRTCLDEFSFALLDTAKGGFEGANERPLHQDAPSHVTSTPAPLSRKLSTLASNARVKNMEIGMSRHPRRP